jgi:hypothetical protein
MFLNFKRFLGSALDYLRTLFGHVELKEWRAWSHKDRVYVRFVFFIEELGIKVVVFKFTKDGFSLIPDYDPRSEILPGEEASDGKLARP